MDEMESLELREKLEVAMKRLGEVLADDAAICAALADVWKVFRYVVEHESFGAVSKTLMDSAQKSIEAAVAEGSGSQYVRRSEVEKVQAEAAAMREACSLAVRLLGNPDDPAGTFDDLAEWFYRESHLMAPGKSVPLVMASTQNDEKRRLKWDEWSKSKQRLVFEKLSAALSSDAGKDLLERKIQEEREECARWWDDTEARSAEAHAVYQAEAHRRGDVRHPDAYADLSEATKEWDRVLVRWVAATIRARGAKRGD